MDHNQFEIREILNKNKLIPVVTIDKISEIENIIETLIENEIGCIEITLRTQYSWPAIKKIRSIYGNKILIGVIYVAKK